MSLSEVWKRVVGPLFWKHVCVLYSPGLTMTQRPESSLSQRASPRGCPHLQPPGLQMTVAHSSLNTAPHSVTFPVSNITTPFKYGGELRVSLLVDPF